MHGMVPAPADDDGTSLGHTDSARCGPVRIEKREPKRPADRSMP
jgi:hypothetical protein